MYRERIADDVYVFTSGLYAQVTAGAIVTPEGAVVIDTLPFPSETRQILEFLNHRSPVGVRYLILTHYHADHTLGASLFKGVPIISHALCRELLAGRGPASLASAREQNPELAEVALRLPDIVFDSGELSVRLGGKQITLTHLPGHSPDVVSVYIRDDKILFASDAMTPVPITVDGDLRQMIDSLRRIKQFGLESIVQGHGEMILRGEINESINSNVNYLHRILALVAHLLREDEPREVLREYGIESCGKSRIPLHGLVQQFHFGNLYGLYERMKRDVELYKLGLRLYAEREVAKTDPSKGKATRAGVRKPPAAPKKKAPAAARRNKKKKPASKSGKSRARRR